MTDAAYEQGMRMRRQMLGDAFVDKAITRTIPFNAGFQELVTRHAWTLWARPELEPRERSLIMLAMLAALGREAELEVHVRVAVGNGVTPQEISEALLHVAVFAGVPAGNGAFNVARRVLEDMGELGSTADDED